MAHQPYSRGGSQGEGPALTRRGDTIAAVATPPGRGGIGIVRVSGPDAARIGGSVCGADLTPRRARFATFVDASGAPIDQGIVLLFAAPRSYTGEDVVELQGHGGTMVTHRLLQRVLELGSRIAEPGEFTRRAFLNDRIDLAQAEAVADVIDASSEEGARSAARSLTGEFSKRVHQLVEAVTVLRMHVEACIDFPEEEIDPADLAAQRRQLDECRRQLGALLTGARQGVVLREGLTAVLIGRPNVGKSSLLNRLAGDEIAIVTAIAGTTRDYVKATIHLHGVPIHLVDTAGLREATDEVERLGIERAWRAVDGAGAVIFVSDNEADAEEDERLVRRIPTSIPVARVLNKIDIQNISPGRSDAAEGAFLRISATSGAGLEALSGWLLEVAGWRPTEEGVFLARQRHLEALESAREALFAAHANPQLELAAEELRICQRYLGTLTGEVSTDDILGRIFSSFCIGK